MCGLDLALRLWVAALISKKLSCLYIVSIEKGERCCYKNFLKSVIHLVGFAT